MLKEEFLKLTGMDSIDDIEYQTYEQVYDDLPEMDKQTFCKLLMSQSYKILGMLDYKLAATSQRAAFYRAQSKVLAEKVIIAEEHITTKEKQEAYDKAVETLGMPDTIKLKVEKGLKLTEDEMDYLKHNLH